MRHEKCTRFSYSQHGVKVAQRIYTTVIMHMHVQPLQESEANFLSLEKSPRIVSESIRQRTRDSIFQQVILSLHNVRSNRYHLWQTDKQ